MAVLDMLDSWGLGGRVVGMPKSSTVDYLKTYNENEAIVNLGTLKEVDMESADGQRTGSDFHRRAG